MRKISIIFFMIFIMITFIACKSSKNKAVEKITMLEKELFSTVAKIDTAKIQQLIDLYVGYADKYKTDSISSIYLLKAADISMNNMKPLQSISLLDRIMCDYPSFSKTPDCLFLKAFIYENQTKELEKAEKTYKEFLQKYPLNELAPSAQAAIDNIGIPLDSLIKSFEVKNKALKDSI